MRAGRKISMFDIYQQLFKTPENLVGIFLETPTHLIIEQIVNGAEPELEFLDGFLEIYINTCQTPDMQANAIINKVEWVVRYLQYIKTEVVIAKTRLKHIKDYTK